MYRASPRAGQHVGPLLPPQRVAEEALSRAIRREKFRIAGERYAGSLKAEDYPYWRTSEDVVTWVRMMRAEETSTDVDLE